MALSKEALDELQAERDRLIEDIRSIETILIRNGRSASSQIPGAQSTAAVIRSAAARLWGEGAGPRDFAGLRLRDAVRVVLADANRGLKPSEVTEHLVRGAFDAGDASTPFGIRVSSEMSRMYRKGELKRSKGRYRIKKDG